MSVVLRRSSGGNLRLIVWNGLDWLDETLVKVESNMKEFESVTAMNAVTRELDIPGLRASFLPYTIEAFGGAISDPPPLDRTYLLPAAGTLTHFPATHLTTIPVVHFSRAQAGHFSIALQTVTSPSRAASSFNPDSMTPSGTSPFA